LEFVIADESCTSGEEMIMKKTTENQQLALARRHGLVVQELPDEVLMYDLTQHKAHCLNQTAAFVWNHCDGETTVGEIAKLMEAEWQTAVSEDEVWLALDRLSKADLLEERIILPAAKAGISRRNAVRQLGLGAVLALPAVMSLVSPTAAQSASVPVPCQSCVKRIDGVGSCPTVCEQINGRCFDNSGCGNGQLIGPSTCLACLASGATRSWVAP
jgi:coenzyme PQQ synthesis protein D (PqqD)